MCATAVDCISWLYSVTGDLNAAGVPNFRRFVQTSDRVYTATPALLSRNVTPQIATMEFAGINKYTERILLVFGYVSLA